MEPITKERLLKYIFLKKESDSKLDQLARLRSREHFPEHRESDGSKHQPTCSDRVGNAFIRRDEYQTEIADRVEENCKEMALIERAIAALEDPMERMVLELRYIDCESYQHRKWNEVAIQMYRDDGANQLRAVHRLHSRALQNIRRIKA